MKSVLLDYARQCTSKDYFEEVVYDRELNMSVYNDGQKRVPLIYAEKMKLHELLPHGFVFKMRVYSEEYRIELLYTLYRTVIKYRFL